MSEEFFKGVMKVIEDYKQKKDLNSEFKKQEKMKLIQFYVNSEKFNEINDYTNLQGFSNVSDFVCQTIKNKIKHLKNLKIFEFIKLFVKEKCTITEKGMIETNSLHYETNRFLKERDINLITKSMLTRSLYKISERIKKKDTKRLEPNRHIYEGILLNSKPQIKKEKEKEIKINTKNINEKLGEKMSEEIIVDLICDKIKENLKEITEINERVKEIDSKLIMKTEMSSKAILKMKIELEKENITIFEKMLNILEGNEEKDSEYINKNIKKQENKMIEEETWMAYRLCNICGKAFDNEIDFFMHKKSCKKLSDIIKEESKTKELETKNKISDLKTQVFHSLNNVPIIDFEVFYEKRFPLKNKQEVKEYFNEWFNKAEKEVKIEK